MTRLQQQMAALGEAEYADFCAKLTPGIPRESILGVRVPKLRTFARGMTDAERSTFLAELPHTYYEENMLHSILISEMKDGVQTVKAVDAFLPYVDNWAVCDTLSPKSFAKDHRYPFGELRRWIASPHVYTCRFGIGAIMRYFLEEDFRPELLELPASIETDEYYINMMTAWCFATALAKQWDSVISYLQQNRLPLWVHNKTIQKAVESYRITPEQKDYLRNLRRK